MKKTSSRRIAEHPEKFCHICGELVKLYIIENNAPYCSECRQDLFEGRKKKVPSEGEMVQKILGGKE